MDTNLTGEAFVSLNEHEIWNEKSVYGEKLSPDGTLLFRPLTDALDIVDGRTGILRVRIALPVTLSLNYDALVADGEDSALIAITGQNGDGIAVIDLNSVPEPSPLAYLIDVQRNVPGMSEMVSKSANAAVTTAAKAGAEQSIAVSRQLPHATTKAYLSGPKKGALTRNLN